MPVVVSGGEHTSLLRRKEAFGGKVESVGSVWRGRVGWWGGILLPHHPGESFLCGKACVGQGPETASI